MAQHDEKQLVQALLRWFRASARDLPWRTLPLGSARDPYRVLVSEIMLQQTQASRVSARFGNFMRRFPTVRELAASEETDVLALWSGLGYYRRARLLRDAACVLAREHAGAFPTRAADLAALPGVGRYTAGAVASLAFHERTPAVDANVARVMLRLEGRELPVSDPAASTLAWTRAEALHRAAPRTRPAPALLNEALIELGALICTPRAPRCGSCPLAGWCRARERGLADCIPARKPKALRKPLYLAAVIVSDPAGRLAVTRRPAAPGTGGLWAGLHEAPTVERPDRPATAAEIRLALGLARGPRTLRRVESFPFLTTHRACTFDVYAAAAPAAPPPDWIFLDRASIAELGLSTPQRRILLGRGKGAAEE
ncbi:MAG TPA: A/G-specific adenine glycosylase [Phycisphaerales bacterium]|nr:A/G-specific adenine glycosylase [Phycisphaerales bacterium]